MELKMNRADDFINKCYSSAHANSM